MTVKHASKNDHPNEPVLRFFMADDFRPELSGKITAVGLYLDNVVVIKLPPGTPEPSEEAPIFLENLAFLINVTNLPDPVTLTIEQKIDSKKRHPLISPQVVSPEGTNTAINIRFASNPCKVVKFGVKTLIVTIDKKEYEFQFEFKKDVSSPADSTPILKTKPEAPKKRKPQLQKSSKI